MEDFPTAATRSWFLAAWTKVARMVPGGETSARMLDLEAAANGMAVQAADTGWRLGCMSRYRGCQSPS